MVSLRDRVMGSHETERVHFFFPARRGERVTFYLIFLILSTLLHWVLGASLPDRLWTVEPLPPRDKKELSVEMVSAEDILPQWRYFESNPNVPSHAPDVETPLISDKDQQAAQPEETIELDELMPAMQGDAEESNKVASGNAVEQREALSALQEEMEVAMQELANSELPGGGGAPLPFSPLEMETTEGEQAAGLPSTQDRVETAEVDTPLPENSVVVIGPQNSPIPGPGQGTVFAERRQQDQEQRRQPRPRPRLRATNLPGPVLSSKAGSKRIGEVSANARFHEFGDYMSRLVETIGHQWYSLVDDTYRSSSMATGRVRVKFTLNKEGEVEKLEILEQEGVPRQAVLICQDAVMAISPFSSWTDAMISLLGDSQDITINFIYGP